MTTTAKRIELHIITLNLKLLHQDRTINTGHVKRGRAAMIIANKAEGFGTINFARKKKGGKVILTPVNATGN